MNNNSWSGLPSKYLSQPSGKERCKNKVLKVLHLKEMPQHWKVGLQLNLKRFFSEAKLSLTCSATKSPTLSICGGGFCHPIIILFINWLHSADFGMKCKIILVGITFEIRIAGIMLKKHNFQMSWCLHWHSSTCGLCRHQDLTEDCQDGIQVTIMLLA